MIKKKHPRKYIQTSYQLRAKSSLASPASGEDQLRKPVGQVSTNALF
jgi:hypothetical protein